MFCRRLMILAFTFGILSVASHAAWAEDSASTTISVEGMHCAGCASKVAKKLEAITGVAKAQVDAEKSVATVSAKPSANPSPKAMWEAVEKAGYKPTKLVGPAGTFTSKPKA